MKRTTILSIYAVIITALLLIIANQIQDINTLQKQLNATENVIYQVQTDCEDYWLDVMSETDVYLTM